MSNIERAMSMQPCAIAVVADLLVGGGGPGGLTATKVEDTPEDMSESTDTGSHDVDSALLQGCVGDVLVEDVIRG